MSKEVASYPSPTLQNDPHPASFTEGAEVERKIPFSLPFEEQWKDAEDSKILPTTTRSVFDTDAFFPALYLDEDRRLLRPQDDIQKFLRRELTISRLNDIHSWLWLAGRPMAARPLHRQKMMSREIVVTEDINMHLVWSGSRIYIKPFPTYLLIRKSWIKIESDVFKYACGFIRSYAWLVRNESDFEIAKDIHLLSSYLDWPRWKALLDEFFKSTGDPTLNFEKVDQRYHFGELRLGRLNMIYRFAPQFRLRNLIRGYSRGYNQYGTFFERNFAWLITVFAYITIIIIAMTLGLTTDRLKGDVRFQNASYGFTIFSIVVPVIVVGVMMLLLVTLFTNNFIATRVFLRQRRKEGCLC